MADAANLPSSSEYEAQPWVLMAGGVTWGGEPRSEEAALYDFSTKHPFPTYFL